MSEESNRKARAQMGLPVSGELDGEEGLGCRSMSNLMDKAIDATVKKKRDRKKSSGRKRGGQPGNKNAVGRHGVYSQVEGFDVRFQEYSRALGKVDAQEEVALTRAMLMNMMRGKDPLGIGEIDDAETLNAYFRDVLMLNIRAQDLFLKQESKRLEQEEKKGAKSGVNITFSSEMKQAMDGMVAAQEAAAQMNAEEAAAEPAEVRAAEDVVADA